MLAALYLALPLIVYPKQGGGALIAGAVVGILLAVLLGAVGLLGLGISLPLSFDLSLIHIWAWTITRGMKAPQAAGKIHSDFERGFIRAEVIAYDDMVACGSEKVAKEKGLMRSEGKEYVVDVYKRQVFHQLPERPVGGEGLRRGVGPAVGEQPLQWAGDDASAFIITHS